MQAVSDRDDVAFVGGWVRDTLIGRESGDVDLSVGDPEGFLEALRAAGSRRAVCLDALRGTWRVVLTSGRFVDVCALKGADFDEDLRARDLTINAIAWVPGRGVIDPLGGVEDLHNHTLRRASPTAIADDPLRALRVVRFATRLKSRPDDALKAELDSADLERVADERIRTELSAILVEDEVLFGLELMEASNLLRVLPPTAPERLRRAMGLDWSSPSLARIRAQVATEGDGELALRLGWLLADGVDMEALTLRRWPKKVARRAALLTSGEAMGSDDERARQLVAWKCGAAFVLCRIALDGGEEAVAPYLKMLDEAPGARNPKALPVPPIPKALLPGSRMHAELGGGRQISDGLDALVVAQLCRQVETVEEAEGWLAERKAQIV
jgi:tRNA nucleotidyltransferase/poly(A) polymerase